MNKEKKKNNQKFKIQIYTAKTHPFWNIKIIKKYYLQFKIC